jgi:two-component system OmpR family sensor kinase
VSDPRLAATAPGPLAGAVPIVDPQTPGPPARGWLARVPLSVQLVALLLVLSTIGLTLAGVVATTSLRGYLTKQVDDEVRSAFNEVARDPQRYFNADGPALLDPLFLSIRNADGDVVQERRLDSRSDLDDPALPAELPAGPNGADHPFSVPGEHSSSPAWRVAAVQAPDGSTLFVARSLEGVEKTTNRLLYTQLFVGAGILLVLGALGYAVVRRSLRPLHDIEGVAEAIATGDLARRVPEPDDRTEVGRLAGALNGMLARIEGAVREREAAANNAQHSEERMRRFIADASHELRTPLTSIRGFAELYRQGAVPPGEEADRVMGRIESEARRMNVLVEDLLQLARLDQSRPFVAAPVDLVPLVVDAAYDARAVAPDREFRVETGGAPHAVVLGDEVRLRQVLGNLVSNAITHTPAGSPVGLRLSAGPGEIVVEVVDRGPGLTPDQVARVFERFYRADAARSRVAGGSGLGLAIVHAIVLAHGGRVEVLPTPGGGATFRVRLPVVAPIPPAPSH